MFACSGSNETYVFIFCCVKDDKDTTQRTHNVDTTEPTDIYKNIPLYDNLRLLVPSCISSNRKLNSEIIVHRTQLYLKVMRSFK